MSQVFGCATRSIPDCVRMELRTVLAVRFAAHTNAFATSRKSPARLTIFIWGKQAQITGLTTVSILYM